MEFRDTDWSNEHLCSFLRIIQVKDRSISHLLDERVSPNLCLRIHSPPRTGDACSALEFPYRVIDDFSWYTGLAGDQGDPASRMVEGEGGGLVLCVLLALHNHPV